MDKRLTEILGIFLGSVQGFILAKVYQIWAILYHMEGLRLAGKSGWSDTPIWVFSIENPTIFLVIVVVIFAFIGLSISKTIISNKN